VAEIAVRRLRDDERAACEPLWQGHRAYRKQV
jgi:hypothetical protein